MSVCEYIHVSRMSTLLPFDGSRVLRTPTTWYGRLFRGPVGWFWRKVSNQRKEFTESYRTTTRDMESIRKAICESKGNLERILHDRCRHVVVGESQHYELGKEFDRVSFRMPMHITDGRFPTEVFGLTVHVVPWFDGILVLPDLETK